MSQQSVLNEPEFMNEPRKPTGLLNVLTILTMIGSAIALISAVWSYSKAESSYKELKNTMESGKLDDAPKWMKGMMTPELLEASRKMAENKMPILIITVVGALLCLYGAIEMRKLKKQGYFLWLAGEIIPIIGMIVLVGTATLSGFGAIGLIIPVVFIILYTIAKKDLVY